MASFFTVETASYGNLLIPLDNLLWVNTGGATTTDLYYANGAATATLDVITLTHDSESAPFSLGSMLDVIQQLIVESAQSKWSEATMDITNRVPATISNVAIGTA
tara:strand:- start:397 stop:711 length:315 start_codon:yes stop_codon:yes gene_type:complete